MEQATLTARNIVFKSGYLVSSTADVQGGSISMSAGRLMTYNCSFVNIRRCDRQRQDRVRRRRVRHVDLHRHHGQHHVEQQPCHGCQRRSSGGGTCAEQLQRLGVPQELRVQVERRERGGAELGEDLR